MKYGMKEWQKAFGVEKMPIGAYCSPQPPATYNGEKYPSKITLKHYKMLADMGVNLIYAHAEQMNTDSEKWAFKALDLCQKVGIKYLVRDRISYEYVANGLAPGEIAYQDLTNEQKQELDKRFIESTKKYIDHPACAGVSFYDEPGVISFKGIAAAQKVFKKHYPDKIFYVNLSPNNVAPGQLEFGSHYAQYKVSEDQNLKIGVPNDKRYEYYLNKYFEAGVPDLVSYDSYPFTTLANVESVVHNTLWEIQQIVNCYVEKYDVPYWNFLQIGGKWDGWYREVDYNEMLLQIHVSLAYGAKGLELFPCVFPNDYLGGNFCCGVIDQYGEPTKYYYWLTVILKQVKAVEKYLMTAEFKNTITAGKYEGLLPSEEVLSAIPWNEVIYRGELPVYGNKNVETYKELIGIDASSQVLIGCFDYNGKTLFYLVNNSIVAAANVKLQFDAEYALTFIKDGKEETLNADSLYIQRLAAGEGVLIKLN